MPGVEQSMVKIPGFEAILDFSNGTFTISGTSTANSQWKTSAIGLLFWFARVGAAGVSWSRFPVCYNIVI